MLKRSPCLERKCLTDFIVMMAMPWLICYKDRMRNHRKLIKGFCVDIRFRWEIHSNLLKIREFDFTEKLVKNSWIWFHGKNFLSRTIQIHRKSCKKSCIDIRFRCEIPILNTTSLYWNFVIFFNKKFLWNTEKI